MLQRVSALFSNVREVAGVDIHVHPDNEIEVAVIILKRNKKQVEIVQKKEFKIDQLEKIFAELPKDLPFALSINGKNVLHKKITNFEEGDDLKKRSSVAFPSISLDDFYIQSLDVEGGCILSLSRKEFINSILDTFKSQNLSVLSLTLGPFEVNNFIPMMENIGENFQVGNHQLNILNHRILDYRTTSGNYPRNVKIGEESLRDNYLIPYALALNQVVGIATDIHHNMEAIVHLLDEWKQKQMFTKLGWTVLSVFFIILLSNFLVFTNLNEKNIELQSSVDINKSSLEELKKLDEQVKDRKSFLKNAGWLNNTRSSFFCDRIASTVPSEIGLIELNVNPLDEKKTRQEKKPVIINNKIQVKGTCNDPAILNKWLGRVKEFSWVRDIKEQNYTYDYNKRIGNFNFNIELKE